MTYKYKLSRRRFLHAGMAAGLGLGATVLPGGLMAQEESEGLMGLPLTGSIRNVHDPVIIKADGTYHLFSTGGGIQWRRSDNLLDWKLTFPSRIFGNLPDWVQEAIPGQGDVWAPDVSYFNDKYHIYYSVSTFGSSRSVIGLLTNKSLTFGDDDYEWVDEGLVVETFRESNYNAIDANLILDEDDTPWLVFGSHWSGIKMHRLDYETGKISIEDDTLYALASRREHPRAVEAPFMIRRDGFYYLFVSFDQCCNGASSTYRVMVGRSEAITGPFVDRDGVDMMDDGGTQITFPTERWRGPGHNAIFQDDDETYIVFHTYDAENQGIPTLQVAPLIWDDDGWPSLQAESE